MEAVPDGGGQLPLPPRQIPSEEAPVSSTRRVAFYAQNSGTRGEQDGYTALALYQALLYEDTDVVYLTRPGPMRTTLVDTLI